MTSIYRTWYDTKSTVLPKPGYKKNKIKILGVRTNIDYPNVTHNTIQVNERANRRQSRSAKAAWRQTTSFEGTSMGAWWSLLVADMVTATSEVVIQLTWRHERRPLYTDEISSSHPADDNDINDLIPLATDELIPDQLLWRSGSGKQPECQL